MKKKVTTVVAALVLALCLIFGATACAPKSVTLRDWEDGEITLNLGDTYEVPVLEAKDTDGKTYEVEISVVHADTDAKVTLIGGAFDILDAKGYKVLYTAKTPNADTVKTVTVKVNDEGAPVIIVRGNNIAEVGEKFMFPTATVTDDSGEVIAPGFKVYRGETEIASDADGFTPTEVGEYTLKISARDSSGNVGSASFDVFARLHRQKGEIDAFDDKGAAIQTFAKSGLVKTETVFSSFKRLTTSLGSVSFNSGSDETTGFYMTPRNGASTVSNLGENAYVSVWYFIADTKNAERTVLKGIAEETVKTNTWNELKITPAEVGEFVRWFDGMNTGLTPLFSVGNGGGTYRVFVDDVFAVDGNAPAVTGVESAYEGGDTVSWQVSDDMSAEYYFAGSAAKIEGSSFTPAMSGEYTLFVGSSDRTKQSARFEFTVGEERAEITEAKWYRIGKDSPLPVTTVTNDGGEVAATTEYTYVDLITGERKAATDKIVATSDLFGIYVESTFDGGKIASFKIINASKYDYGMFLDFNDVDCITGGTGKQEWLEEFEGAKGVIKFSPVGISTAVNAQGKWNPVLDKSVYEEFDTLFFKLYVDGPMAGFSYNVEKKANNDLDKNRGASVDKGAGFTKGWRYYGAPIDEFLTYFTYFQKESFFYFSQPTGAQSYVYIDEIRAGNKMDVTSDVVETDKLGREITLSDNAAEVFGNDGIKPTALFGGETLDVSDGTFMPQEEGVYSFEYVDFDELGTLMHGAYTVTAAPAGKIFDFDTAAKCSPNKGKDITTEHVEEFDGATDLIRIGIESATSGLIHFNTVWRPTFSKAYYENYDKLVIRFYLEDASKVSTFSYRVVSEDDKDAKAYYYDTKGMRHNGWNEIAFDINRDCEGGIGSYGFQFSFKVSSATSIYVDGISAAKSPAISDSVMNSHLGEELTVTTPSELDGLTLDRFVTYNGEDVTVTAGSFTPVKEGAYLITFKGENEEGEPVFVERRINVSTPGMIASFDTVLTGMENGDFTNLTDGKNYGENHWQWLEEVEIGGETARGVIKADFVVPDDLPEERTSAQSSVFGNNNFPSIFTYDYYNDYNQFAVRLYVDNPSVIKNLIFIGKGGDIFIMNGSLTGGWNTVLFNRHTNERDSLEFRMWADYTESFTMYLDSVYMIKVEPGLIRDFTYELKRDTNTSTNKSGASSTTEWVDEVTLGGVDAQGLIKMNLTLDDGKTSGSVWPFDHSNYTALVSVNDYAFYNGYDYFEVRLFVENASHITNFTFKTNGTGEPETNLRAQLVDGWNTLCFSKIGAGDKEHGKNFRFFVMIVGDATVYLDSVRMVNTLTVTPAEVDFDDMLGKTFTFDDDSESVFAGCRNVEREVFVNGKKVTPTDTGFTVNEYGKYVVIYSAVDASGKAVRGEYTLNIFAPGTVYDFSNETALLGGNMVNGSARVDWEYVDSIELDGETATGLVKAQWNSASGWANPMRESVAKLTSAFSSAYYNAHGGNLRIRMWVKDINDFASFNITISTSAGGNAREQWLMLNDTQLLRNGWNDVLLNYSDTGLEYLMFGFGANSKGTNGLVYFDSVSIVDVKTLTATTDFGDFDVNEIVLSDNSAQVFANASALKTEVFFGGAALPVTNGKFTATEEGYYRVVYSGIDNGKSVFATYNVKHYLPGTLYTFDGLLNNEMYGKTGTTSVVTWNHVDEAELGGVQSYGLAKGVWKLSEGTNEAASSIFEGKFIPGVFAAGDYADYNAFRIRVYVENAANITYANFNTNGPEQAFHSILKDGWNDFYLSRYTNDKTLNPTFKCWIKHNGDVTMYYDRVDMVKLPATMLEDFSADMKRMYGTATSRAWSFVESATLGGETAYGLLKIDFEANNSGLWVGYDNNLWGGVLWHNNYETYADFDTMVVRFYLEGRANLSRLVIVTSGGGSGEYNLITSDVKDGWNTVKVPRTTASGARFRFHTTASGNATVYLDSVTLEKSET